MCLLTVIIQKLQLMNGDIPRFPLYALSLTCQFIELFPADFHCGVHGWDLLLRAHKLLQHFLKLLLRNSLRMLFQCLTRYVLSIGHKAQPKSGQILFFVIFTELYCPRSTSKEHSQHPSGHGIQRTGMSDPPLLIDSPKLCHNVMGRPALRLIHNDDTVHQSFTPLWAMASKIRSFASETPPGTVAPAAALWPPPPNCPQMSEALWASSVRSEIFAPPSRSS